MSVDVTDATFQRDVLASARPVLVDFWTEWCAPCKPLAAALDEISAELNGKITIAKVNAETSPNVTNRYGVRGFPTMLIFKEAKCSPRAAAPCRSRSSKSGSIRAFDARASGKETQRA